MCIKFLIYAAERVLSFSEGVKKIALIKEKETSLLLLINGKFQIV